MTLVENPRRAFDPFAPPMIDDGELVDPAESIRALLESSEKPKPAAKTTKPRTRKPAAKTTKPRTRKPAAKTKKETTDAVSK